jgi:N-acyl homoserine lactone hydrolase
MNKILGALFLCTLLCLPSARALDAAPSVQLFALDGGTLEFTDLGMFSDGGEYDGKPGTFAAPAFLIRHPKGDLLWDTGLGDALSKQPAGLALPGGITMKVSKTVASQLAELGLAPRDIEYVAFSHLHADHTGNAGLFPGATWVVSQKELAWATSKPTPRGVDPRMLTGRRKVLQDAQDIDLFGDGSVRILRTPGHTPDHRVLLVKLAHAGTVLLSGDLYHIKDSVKDNRVPGVNVSRADTLASFDRAHKLLQQHKARLIVQHAPEDFAALPRFPAFLD